VDVGSAVVPQALSTMLNTTMRAIRAKPFLENFIFRDSPPNLTNLEVVLQPIDSAAANSAKCPALMACGGAASGA
jgi:hypothetical protein